MRIRTRILIASALAAALSLAPLSAHAAPQILGLMASNGLPTPMTCDGSSCTALLASFCLQEAREAPSYGQEYRPGTRGGLDLILARADGTHMTIGANELVAINLYEGLS